MAKKLGFRATDRKQANYSEVYSKCSTNHLVGIEKEVLWTVMPQHLVSHPLFLITCLHRVCIEYTILTRWSWVKTFCLVAMSYSLSSQLLVGFLFDIFKAILCQEFSIGFQYGDWTSEQTSPTFWCWSDTSSECMNSMARWHVALSS